MEKIRIGNTFEVLWGIFVGDGINEKPYDLTGRDISIYVKTPLIDKQKVESFSIDRHIISWRFEGKDQKKVGTYTMTLVENEGKKDMHTVDECEAFKLVSESCQTGCSCNSDNDNVQIKTLEFRSKMSVGFPSSGGGSDIVIDNVLSESSENPVQNKVVTSAINDLKTSLSGLSQSVSSLSNKVEGYSEEIANATSKSEEATKAVEGITEQINGIIEEVGSLSDKVESLENGEITWTDVQ